MLDPDASTALQLAADSGAPALETMTPAEARAFFSRTVPLAQAPREDVPEVRDITVHGLAGPIPLRFYRGEGASAEEAPCLVYFHGGGWVIGDLETHDTVCRQIANLAQSVVISVDYRLAPEHPFPAAIEDGAAALRHILAKSADWGIDPTRIAVGGDSAGGNIAAVLAVLSRDGQVPPIAFQILFYPVTDLSQTQESYRAYADGYGLTTAGMAWFRHHYIGAGGNPIDGRTSPLMTHSLADVAPAFIMTAGYDVLHDEGRDYAARLQKEGVAVQLDENPGQIHGFISMDGVIAAARPALARAVAAWRASDVPADEA